MQLMVAKGLLLVDEKLVYLANLYDVSMDE